ncbi:BMC domain-containing protein [Bacillaceae bacterium Marseille-Q3522]|nr:BMC domain-containing protein [Bacillaceae bacterium Marseille-Q3522]
MSQDALGLIEVIGLTAALEAADASLKAANVQLLGYEKVTAGLVTVKIQGDVAAVKAALEAAKTSAGKIGTIVSVLVIPRPASGIRPLIKTISEKKDKPDRTTAEEQSEPDSRKPLQEQENGEERDLQKIDENEDTKKNEITNDITINDYTEETADQGNAKKNTNMEKETHSSVTNTEMADSKTNVTCNLCHDPLCPREKGQPRTQCIHYQDEG